MELIIFSDFDKKNDSNLPVKFLWSGRLIPTKNYLFLLEVLSQIKSNIKWELTVMGDGPQRNNYETKVVDLNFKDKVRFVGNIPYNETNEFYKETDIFLFPSIREGSPTVILEAMANSIPVIAFNMNGADIMLDRSCGILIPVITNEQMVNDFANAINYLCENHQIRLEMGLAAQKKVEENYLWKKRGELINQYYKSILL